MDNNDLPSLSLELVEALERLYPRRPATEAVTEDGLNRLNFELGKLSVVAFLRTRYEQQQVDHHGP